ncbi:mandelate racemase [Mesorhizobium sp. M2A.F.Ca.ET.037.01.1.1]|uniref:mandelate racemase/muconate lactonizing enzyme family protein n=1 Tax=unclassified Mesorhizobium TaxID=325217 RepID=UPI000F76203F|nr:MULTISPECIES: mandelate racemase/muconate lactonizing enzyme family protein [unclassified Mesorhizobium]RUX99317.1 mandelate racemase [Mesorhizobium sp. M2A.F.Ca.ET.040.01.1.1]RVC69757.1 mandelate racemase [Mesorhizobium sp. M00.F.Ca.ET.038.03.1.1]AZO33117.1 mandelate racemase [Mesorhizobium sp. M2A.F.Ca.ET.046.03.2.1]RUX20885.1 mandelate racemase [Mesorhizobium sp. M2A.F.Ca.ET.037.01.1.1]RWA85471.1 MAG: mandelate racemase [Mesorhizobium sp.]
MRIERINVYSAQLPVRGGVYRMASADVEALDSSLVEIITNDGLTGWGETCPIGPVYQPHHALGARAAIAEIAPGLIGAEVASIRLLAKRMDERLNGHGYAKAAFDMAFLDLLGQKLGVPVSTLLGGALTDRVPAYYSLIVGEPEETARIAADKVKAGYPRLQVKIGGRNLEEDVAVVHKVWEAVGYKARLAVDGNRGLTVAAALHLDRLCQQIPFVFEQPCNTMEEIATLRGRVTHPVYLDESTEDQNAVLRAISMGIADGFGFKVTRLGGLTRMTTVRDLCAIRSLPHSCDDAWGGDIIAAACVHLAATVEPRRMEGAWIAQEYIKGHFDQEHPVVIKQGHIAVPQRPGLGVKPEPGMFGKPVAIYGP